MSKVNTKQSVNSAIQKLRNNAERLMYSDDKELANEKEITTFSWNNDNKILADVASKYDEDVRTHRIYKKLVQDEFEQHSYLDKIENIKTDKPIESEQSSESSQNEKSDEYIELSDITENLEQEDISFEFEEASKEESDIAESTQDNIQFMLEDLMQQEQQHEDTQDSIQFMLEDLMRQEQHLESEESYHLESQHNEHSDIDD